RAGHGQKAGATDTRSAVLDFCMRNDCRFGDLVKILWHDGVGMSLYLKRLEAGKFIWPASGSGEAVQISAAQLGYLLEGIDWRNPRWTQRPAKVG
ncbi:IS66 family insertion sequence element accessory protein TnpB, partial [Roseovarius sp. MBR-6]|uniref:IS66 family insertion sequence element accessory protein TnpB n=1 Tax=Roseovarius sp. MBR-6 TaxID=3156459 RepID=UPI003397AF2B